MSKILAQADSDLGSISDLTANVVAFADAWRVATSAKTTVEVEAQLYPLGTLHSSAGVIGKPHAAKRDDIDLLTDWFDQFHVEAFGSVFAPDSSRAFLDHLLQLDTLTRTLEGRAVRGSASRTQPGSERRIDELLDERARDEN